MTTNLVPVKATDVPENWLIAKAILRPAIERSNGRQSVETVYRALLKQHFQLWLITKTEGVVCAIITEVFTHPTGLHECCILFVAGTRREDWLHHCEDICLWAVAEGCERVSVNGRSGWAPDLLKLGFKRLDSGWERVLKGQRNGQ